MAAIPDATLAIQDNALGIVEPNEQASAIIGTCSSGTINTYYTFADLKSLTDTLVSGPAVEAAAHALAIGGGVVRVVRVDNTSTPGTFSAVTLTGTGSSVLTLTGSTPKDDYVVKVQILVGGANPASGVVTFKYSLDSGNNYSGEIALPTSGIYAISAAGITLNFSAASLVAGDVYSFTTTAPGFNSTEMTTAFNALVANPATWKFLHLVGVTSSAANQATLLTALGALITAQESAYRFAYVVGQMPDLGDGTTGDANSISAFAAFANPRVAVCAGYCDIVSVLTGRTHKRNASIPFCARRQKVPVSEDSMRVARGSLPGIAKLYRDEQTNRGLDAARFVTLRTIVGKQGFYITRGRLMSASGSDYTDVHLREIMDVACTVSRAALVDFLGESVRVNPSTAQVNPGGIDERDARTIEAVVKSKLADALITSGDVSDVTALVNRQDNILSTGELRPTIRVLPKAYGRFINATIGFTNPKLQITG